MKLIFLDPEHSKPGQRVFDVSINGKTVISNLDIVQEAGGKDTIYTEVIDDIELDTGLSIDMKASTGKTLLCGLEIIRK